VIFPLLSDTEYTATDIGNGTRLGEWEKITGKRAVDEADGLLILSAFFVDGVWLMVEGMLPRIYT
jgi:hypothetical protein